MTRGPEACFFAHEIVNGLHSAANKFPSVIGGDHLPNLRAELEAPNEEQRKGSQIHLY